MWKDIIGFEDLYAIDEYGNILSKRQNKVLNTYLNNKGCKCIDLVKDKQKYKFTIHRLVAMHFVPNPNNLPIVLHKNNIKTDTYYENLKWGSYSENNAQAINDGLNRVPKPDNRVYYEVYNPNDESDKKLFRGLNEIKEENRIGGSDSMYRNYLFRNKPMPNGKLKGYKIRKSIVRCPIRFIEFY